ncbi:hypothetical protein ACH3VR_22805 [Microbacterium sp. B2969]|uniref:Uncharacterized protein n=1 Tax=Microbacterium alkaliflavum TaxID=3248839 RepID=A0ABW7QIT2_9MICO
MGLTRAGMGSVQVSYGGEPYTVIDRRLSDVQQQIQDILTSGRPGWLEAVDGYGARAPYQLLITPGVHLSLAVPPTE